MREQRQDQERAPEHDEITEALLNLFGFLRERGLQIALVLGVLLVAVLSYRWHVAQKSAMEQQAWGALSGMPSGALLARIPPEAETDYLAPARQVAEGGTSAAPWALNLLGSALANQGRWQEAAEAYQELFKRFPKSEAADAALPGYAAVLEATEQYDKAAEQYTRLAEQSAAFFYIDAGRCRELAGQVEEAVSAYETFVEQDGDEDMMQVARGRVRDLRQGKTLSLPEPPPEAEPEPPRETTEPATGPAEAENPEE